MSAKRAGPWAIIWRAIFATPFILVGLGSIVIGIMKGAFEAIALGFMFAGAGAFVVWTGVREMRSAESQGTGAVTRAPLGHAAFGGYRELASTKEPTALEVYGSLLAFLPVKKIREKRGRLQQTALTHRARAQSERRSITRPECRCERAAQARLALSAMGRATQNAHSKSMWSTVTSSAGA